ncbi:MAG: transcription antitermination factor NusB [Paracoccaceae bacterium]
MPMDPRELAAQMVAGVTAEGRRIGELSLPDAAPADRARAQRLALATLRNLARADQVLAPYLRQTPAPPVQALMRVATVEMLELGAPAHGVVNAAVSALRAGRKTAAAAGMANAVLRKVAAYEGWSELAVQRLPGWLRRRLKAAYGEPAVLAFEQAHAEGAPLDLTLKPGGAAPEGRELPNGSLRIDGPVQVSALAGFDDGAWWVQDAAASLPATLLAIREGERVLDLCAAPGGKTMQLAAAGGRVTALDVSDARLERLRDNLRRTGLAATVVTADALHWTPDEGFDAVLLDAPCSATGTIRRHPDLPFVRKPADVAALIDLQAALLDRSLGFLKPGGRIVFCTCSLLPDEGEAQITAALARHKDLTVLPLPPLTFGRATPEGGWRTLPNDLPGGNDGFYMALLGRQPR